MIEFCELVYQVIKIDLHVSGYLLTNTERFSGPRSLSKVRELVDNHCNSLGRDTTDDGWCTKHLNQMMVENAVSIQCPKGIVMVEAFFIFYSPDAEQGQPYLGINLDEVIARNSALPTHQIQAQRA